MVRKVAVILGILLGAATAAASPPPMRPIDVPTVYAFCEGARNLQRQAAPHRQQKGRGLRMKTIVIDPGHGGTNLGAIGVAAVREKLLTIELAYALRDALEARDPNVRVVLTRYWDRELGLRARTRWANELGADLFVSLHYNAASHDQAIGVETYFLSSETMATTSDVGNRGGQQATKLQKRASRALDRARVKAHGAARARLELPYERSKALALLAQRELISELQTTDRGVKEANFAVLRGALMPAIVVEAGFLTHPEEGRAVLTDAHRNKVVRALVSAIVAFDATLPAPEPQTVANPS